MPPSAEASSTLLSPLSGSPFESLQRPMSPQISIERSCCRALKHQLAIVSAERDAYKSIIDRFASVATFPPGFLSQDGPSQIPPTGAPGSTYKA
ncbi:hypothetical protein HYDPIDRAFT_111552 [Hydnomerulius pinastri MD-312]|uniref:REJ domain-containing protein n=1 Tax=Hydnomerulius pinastri MD-312 TaxID=994086 RepID=A0A0C9W1S6_9AGAM|nr:hypothetical protein HYDPIDRAFT_111552 [Hydnomerulius pinastri MD-312]